MRNLLLLCANCLYIYQFVWRVYGVARTVVIVAMKQTV